MDLKLNGKLALVTGSSAGIGKGIAKCLLQEGATVFINGRNADTLAKTAEELSSFGPCHMAVGDLGTAEGAQAVIDAVDQFGELDILVGNMGTYKGTPFAEISDEEWEWMMNINLLSAGAHVPPFSAENVGTQSRPHCADRQRMRYQALDRHGALQRFQNRCHRSGPCVGRNYEGYQSGGQFAAARPDLDRKHGCLSDRPRPARRQRSRSGD